MACVKGVTLLEIIISLFLLSFMLLCLDATQLIALRESKSIYYFTAANEQLRNIAAQLSLYKGQNEEGLVVNWNGQNKLLLPQGLGVVSGQFPHYNIFLSWGGFPLESCLHEKVGVLGCARLTL